MSKFEKTARVNVPGGNGTQGVVIDVTESITGFPVYALRWLTDAGETMTGSCGEGDLVNANSPQLSELDLSNWAPWVPMPKQRKPAKKSPKRKR